MDRTALRTFAWLGRDRRLAKDFETTVESSTGPLRHIAIDLPGLSAGLFHWVSCHDEK